jgi:hypothetical protein
MMMMMISVGNIIYMWIYLRPFQPRKVKSNWFLVKWFENDINCDWKMFNWSISNVAMRDISHSFLILFSRFFFSSTNLPWTSCKWFKMYIFIWGFKLRTIFFFELNCINFIGYKASRFRYSFFAIKSRMLIWILSLVYTLNLLL